MNSDLAASVPGAEDIYGLSPVQEGLLADSLYDPTLGLYHCQLLYRLPERVDLEALRAACELVTSQHDVCRTGFLWEGLEQPIQVVYKDVQMPWFEVDLGMATSDWGEQEIARTLEADRKNGFDLGTPPLMRFTLLRSRTEPHYLLWSFHHIILDRWSGEALIRQILDAYEANGEVDEEESLPFGEYIEWLEQRDMGEAEEFWTETLRGYGGGASPVQEVSSARGAADAGGELVTPALPNEIVERLHAVARDCNVTLNTIAQGAWAILVSKYTGQNDVAHGTVMSGRSAELDGIEEAIGLFINILPVRSVVDPTATIKSWLQSLQLHLLEVQEFEFVPLRSIKRWSGVDNKQNLFETVFSFASSMATPSYGSSDKKEEEWETVRAVERASYPLVVEADPERGLEIFTLYDPSRYPREVVERLVNHYRHLLEEIANDPNRRIGSLQLLTENERRQQLVEWNDTAGEYPDNRALHELFEEQVERTPDADAITSITERLTYGELNARANRLARHLRSLGVRNEAIVGVCLDRSPDLVVAFLAVLKAGGTYLPLDPGYPTDRLGYMVADSGVEVVVSRSGLDGWLDTYDGTRVWLDSEHDPTSSQSGENLELSQDPKALAYVIYTSGSTGRPKGSMLPHRGLCNLVVEQQRQFGLGPGDRLLQFAALSFDASTFEFVLALCAGAELCLAPPEGLDGDTLLPFLRKRRITVALFPPSLLAATECQDLPDLTTVMVAGEQCPATVVEQWAPGRRFFNLYGPTEATIWATIQECLPTGEPPAIGRPIQNARVYVLDKHLSPAPVGVAGDLYIGGVGLQRGYLDRPDQTAQRMIPNPYAKEAGERLYRTGDRARFLSADGRLEFLGRDDQQLEIRGHRVEAGEVEAQLATHPSVRDAVVLEKDGRLIAYIRSHRESVSS